MATWRCLRADRGAILREGLRVSCKNRRNHILCRKWPFSGSYRCLRSPRLRFSARREAMRFDRPPRTISRTQRRPPAVGAASVSPLSAKARIENEPMTSNACAVTCVVVSRDSTRESLVCRLARKDSLPFVQHSRFEYVV